MLSSTFGFINNKLNKYTAFNKSRDKKDVLILKRSLKSHWGIRELLGKGWTTDLNKC